MPERAAFVEVRAQRPSRVELVLRTGHVLFVPESFDASARAPRASSTLSDHYARSELDRPDGDLWGAA